MSTNCKNCESIIQGKFCHNCGQKASISKITFKDTFQDFMDMVFSVNAPLMLTLKMLITNPGKLFREYLSGKRKTYYKPVPFFILTTIVYLIIRSLINFDPFENTNIKVSDESTGQLLTKARNYLLLNIDKFLFAYVFTLGLFLKLFFFKKNSFAEFLGISFYLIGFYTLFTVLNMFVIQFLNSDIQFLAIAIMYIYLVYAMISYFQKGKLLIFIKTSFLYYSAFTLYFVFAFGISFLIVWSKTL